MEHVSPTLRHGTLCTAAMALKKNKQIKRRRRRWEKKASQSTSANANVSRRLLLRPTNSYIDLERRRQDVHKSLLGGLIARQLTLHGPSAPQSWGAGLPVAQASTLQSELF